MGGGGGGGASVCMYVCTALSIGVVKQTSLTEAKAITGTCPDMCPEKERYVRQARRRFSIFEMRADSQPGVSELLRISEYVTCM